MNTARPERTNEAKLQEEALADYRRALCRNGRRATSVAATVASVRGHFTLTGKVLWRITAADHQVWQKRLSALPPAARRRQQSALTDFALFLKRPPWRLRLQEEVGVSTDLMLPARPFTPQAWGGTPGSEA